MSLKPIKQSHIASAVADYFDMTEDDLFSDSHRQEFVRGRFALYYILREMRGLSYPSIGEYVGRHHGSVIHGCRAVRSDPERKAQADEIIATLRSPSLQVVPHRTPT